MFRNEKSSADKIRYLTLTDAGKVWMPDTFFRNEKIARFHKILAPNLYIRVFPDGDVLYSIRWHFRNLIAILSRILSSWGPHSSVHVRCFSQGFRWINKLAILTLQAVSFHNAGMLYNWHVVLSPDGWTKNDLIYVWKQEGALQIANNLSLPGIILLVWHWRRKIFEFLGGFILSSTGNQGGATDDGNKHIFCC